MSRASTPMFLGVECRLFNQGLLLLIAAATEACVVQNKARKVECGCSRCTTRNAVLR